MAIAQTISSELVDKINVLLNEAEYADPNKFEARQLKRECDKVLAANPRDGWYVLGCYNSVIGDVDEVRRCFTAAAKLRNDAQVHENYCAGLENLGFFSEAVSLFRSHTKDGYIGQWSFARMPPPSGSFHAVAAYVDSAGNMKQQLLGDLPANFDIAATILSDAGISDEFVGAHLDLAGEVLRRHKLFFEDAVQISAVKVAGVYTGVTCVLRVKSSRHQTFQMNIELSLLEDERAIEKTPLFDVRFAPA